MNQCGFCQTPFEGGDSMSEPECGHWVHLDPLRCAHNLKIQIERMTAKLEREQKIVNALLVKMAVEARPQ